MIQFFRKIRQKLLSEGKTGKYLKYAIGEIVLVVIGILIALQINNLNEQHKSEAFELKMLGEIYKSLSYDNYTLNYILKSRMRLVDSCANEILLMYEKDSIDLVAFNKYALNLGTGFVFSISDGPYETLKTSGLDKVKNDTLRDKLIYHYDYEVPRRINLVSHFTNSIQFEKWRELEEHIFEYKVDYKSDPKIIDKYRYKLNDSKDPIFLKYLRLRMKSNAGGIRNFEAYIRDSEKLIELLLIEFKNRKYEIPEFILL